MPKKVRQIKATLLKLGYTFRQGKGSHVVWQHSRLTWSITIAKKDGADAPDWLEKQVNRAIKELKEMEDSE